MHSELQHNREKSSLDTNLTTELCFDKSEFMKISFSVDEFLHKNRNAPSLELLRDNLGEYLKTLRSSMIDLINQDYADFVSLSANLVGLDQSIETIRKPLEAFKEDILNIKELINDNEKEVSRNLKQKDELRLLKRSMQSLKEVYQTIQNLSNLIEKKLSSHCVKPVDLERAALQLIQLKFNEKSCREYLTDEQLATISELNNVVLSQLRLLFNSSLKTSTSTTTEDLERCLSIYITLDNCSAAEIAFKEDIVASYMNKTISEYHLQNSPQGLAGIYNKVLNFISLHMTDLLRITQYSDRLRGFNFLINSFWSDVEQRLETHMSSIFAPGNSEVFYVKYKCTRDFIQKIEEILHDEESISKFRSHPQTKSFQSRWNLPVYFQICFQEIAGQFEGMLEPILDESKVLEGEEFHITTFKAAVTAVERCWSDSVYLVEIFPKFFKLTIQTIIRLSQWIHDALKLIQNKDFAVKVPKINLLVYFYADINKFMDKLPGFVELICSKIPDSNDVVSETIDDVRKTLQCHSVTIESGLTEILLGNIIENIHQVNDLPRLYRKTNRDVPSKSSVYVEQMLRPVKVFQEGLGEHLDQLILLRILEQVLARATEEYYTSVTEVLTSVQKTEESLRRLRNLKEKPALPQTVMSGGMSDDDKIRFQLRVDVAAWTNELNKMGFKPSQIDKLSELNSITEEKVKPRELLS